LQSRRRDRFDAAAGRLIAALRANRAAHATKIARERERIAALASRAERAVWAVVDKRYAVLERASDLLSAVSYHGVLARGFALVRDREGRPLRSAAAVTAGLPLDIEFADGRIPAVASAAGAARPPRPSLRPRRRRHLPIPGQGNLFGT
jgi:exodeoxyribonuclease VII large subunit